MNVTIDKDSGFCWGVVRTIEIAEEQLRSGEQLQSLGDIIHNPKEINRLEQMGLSTILHSNLNEFRGKQILIRAHGEPPETYKKADELGITLIDATCPVVTKIQERIRKFYLDGYQVLIFGKREHAEVIGLVGQTNGEAIVITSPDETDNIDVSRKTVLFSQTTMDKPTFYLIKEDLEKKIVDFVAQSFEDLAVEFHAKDTICGQVSGREKKLREFAKEHDVILFVAGKKSSNGKVLFHIAKEENEKTFFIEGVDDLDTNWLKNAEAVGITGATSTPQWLMESVKQNIEHLCQS